MPVTFSVEKVITELSISQNEHFPNEIGYSEEFEKLLLDEAEPFYNRIVEAFAGKYINEITTDTISSPQLLHT